MNESYNLDCPPSPDWMIIFEDSDIDPEVFTDEVIALKRFNMLSASWNCHLFKRVKTL